MLIVEDEQHLAEGLRFNLEAEGYGAEVVDTGEAALERLIGGASRAFDLVVLDVMLPARTASPWWPSCAHARQFVPVLMLTARGRPEDVLKGFAAGADDYLPKPTELAILLARIGGLLRRSQWLRRPPDRYTFAGKTIDFDTLELRVGERTLPLTLMEANLLRYLIAHEGKAVSRKAMLEDVWGVHEDTDTRAIDNFIVRLRRYIEKDPAKPQHLLTVRGVGYGSSRSPIGDVETSNSQGVNSTNCCSSAPPASCKALQVGVTSRSSFLRRHGRRAPSAPPSAPAIRRDASFSGRLVVRGALTRLRLELRASARRRPGGRRGSPAR